MSAVKAALLLHEEAYALFMWIFGKSKQRLKAVYEEDLVSYLRTLGVLDDINAGHARCMSCGDEISLQSLEAIIPNGENIKFVCWKKSCLSQLSV